MKIHFHFVKMGIICEGLRVTKAAEHTYFAWLILYANASPFCSFVSVHEKEGVFKVFENLILLHTILILPKNSQFQNLIFLKVHISKISFFTKFTLFKHQIPKHIWIKSGYEIKVWTLYLFFVQFLT